MSQAGAQPKEINTEHLCPDCFKVVGVPARYKIVCLLGKRENSEEGLTVKDITAHLGLKQPTVTHHLQTLATVDAVHRRDCGRECRYTLNRSAHCFEECNIPYD